MSGIIAAVREQYSLAVLPRYGAIGCSTLTLHCTALWCCQLQLILTDNGTLIIVSSYCTASTTSIVAATSTVASA
jgi:hypothetical protein